MRSLLRDEFWPGDELEDYRLLERIGAGGEASVWSAWDTENKRVVAIKFMRKDDPSSTSQSLNAQIDLLRDLEHTNIREIYTIGSSDQFIYFSMPYFPSGSLDDLLIAGALPIRDVLRISAQIVSALEYLHACNIVHRDLKPTNILIDAEGRAYLTDFGIARALSDSTLAYHTGQGTLRYSPPEQHTEAAISKRSDIYSLGVLFYEMLTGTLPWDGDIALAIKQLDTGEGIPDPSEINLNFPPELGDALKILTHVDPQKRPSTASQAYGLIVAALGHQPLDQVTHEAGAFAMQKTIQTISLEPDLRKLALIEAGLILQNSLVGWPPGSQKFDLHITQFAFLNSVYASNGVSETVLNDNERLFMARGALAHGFNHHFWWKNLKDPRQLKQLCEQVIENEDEGVIERVLSLILEEPPRFSLSEMLSPSITSRLIEIAVEASEPILQRKALDCIGQSLGENDQDWKPVGFSHVDDARLANFALTNHPLAVKAAELIGKIRSETAVNALWDAYENGEQPGGLPALVEVMRVVGGLPAGLPGRARLKVGRELTRKQLLSEWSSLLKVYLTAALAAALGLGYHVFATYRLPSFLNSARILNTFGSGLLFGPLLGLGIFLTQFVTTRLQNVSTILRTAIGVIIGGGIVNLSLYAYHLLFLDSNPIGWLMSLGSFIMILGFGVGAGFFHSRRIRALLSASTTGLGLGISWAFSASLMMTPMIYYEVDQPVETFFHICITSLMIGVIPHLVDPLDSESH
jgi:serine/threonine protein kinase